MEAADLLVALKEEVKKSHKNLPSGEQVKHPSVFISLWTED